MNLIIQLWFVILVTLFGVNKPYSNNSSKPSTEQQIQTQHLESIDIVDIDKSSDRHLY